MNWAGALAGAGRGYEAAQGRDIPGPSQQQGQQGGMLMNYMRRRKAGQQAQQAAQAPVAQNPNMAQAAPGWNPSMPIPSVPDNQFQDPYGASPRGFQGTPMAQGRIVDRPTTALLGEDGPEAVIPLNGRPDAKVSTANLPQMKYSRGC